MPPQNPASEFAFPRRDLLKWSMALCGAAALVPARSAPAGQGEWVAAACWHNCGGRCPQYVYVKDGIVLGHKVDDSHPDSPNYPQQRPCMRGHAQKFQVFGADRLKYPMRRRNWEPGGGKKELRGRDEWVRISWDEALDLVAREMKRIKETYGNSAILYPTDGDMRRALIPYGGYVSRWGSISWGTWPDVYRLFTGIPGNPGNTGNDRFRMRQSKLIVMWGSNPAWSAAGLPAYHYLQAKKAGAKFIFVDPHYSDSAQLLADQWIPIRPATDAALLLGMANHIVGKNLQDQAFLDKYCSGFDRDHMPAGADPRDNFKDYLLGTYDGTSKTPEWASRICGVDPETIRRFAEDYATTKPALIQAGGAPARVNNGEQTPHAMMSLACLTGNLGIPGSGAGANIGERHGNAGPGLVRPGPSGVSSMGANPVKVRINNCELWEAVLSGKYTDGLGPKKDVDIRMVYYDLGSYFNQLAGLTKALDAHRKVEFVVTQNYVLNTNAKYSDIVLPVTTHWERYGAFLWANREIQVWSSQVVEPLWEAKDDIWIVKEIGKRLGLDPDKIDPVPLKQQVFNQARGTQVIKPDGSGFEPLVTVTQSDIDEMGVKGEPQKGRIPIKEFKQRGFYQVRRSPGDNLGFTELETYIRDPVGTPLKTSTGKLEIYCQALSERIHSLGFNDKDPLPKYEPVKEGYEESVDGEFPLQLVTPHYPRRAHSCFDNIPQLRAAWPQDFWMNPIDAKARGIENGDTVLVRSRHGKVLRPVFVTERIMPGVTALGEGAWFEYDDRTGIDKAGATNSLNGGIATGQGHTGHNSCLVQVEKYAAPLTPDHEWPQRVVNPLHAGQPGDRRTNG